LVAVDHTLVVAANKRVVATHKCTTISPTGLRITRMVDHTVVVAVHSSTIGPTNLWLTTMVAVEHTVVVAIDGSVVANDHSMEAVGTYHNAEAVGTYHNAEAVGAKYNDHTHANDNNTAGGDVRRNAAQLLQNMRAGQKRIYVQF